MDKGRRIAAVKKKRAGRIGRRGERVQLKLAQFSHSPVIRVRGIYIIKSRKFCRHFTVVAHFCVYVHSYNSLYPARSIGYYISLVSLYIVSSRFLDATERRFVAAII